LDAVTGYCIQYDLKLARMFLTFKLKPYICHRLLQTFGLAHVEMLQMRELYWLVKTKKMVSDGQSSTMADPKANLGQAEILHVFVVQLVTYL